MVNISRNRSRSVNTVPFTFTTGLPLGCCNWTFGAAAAGAGVAASAPGCEATICAESGAIARSSTARVENGRFMVPPIKVLKKGRRNLLPRSNNRLGGRHAHLTVHLVRLATVALTAELRRGVAAGVGVVVAAQEELGVVVTLGSPKVPSDDVLAVLIVAAGAGDGRIAAHDGQTDGKSVVDRCELQRRRAVHIDLAADNRAVPVVLAAAADNSLRTHRVIVLVVAGAGAIVPQESGSGAAEHGQSFHRPALHHGRFRQVAVMAAQAKQDDGGGIVGAGDG